ncbi:hypothetical protein LPJ61_004963, partial [Coemansia biformis]
MAPITRRQSRRLTIEALGTADVGRAQQGADARPGGAGRPATRDSLASVASGNAGRVAKPERKVRTVASRYMSTATGRSTEAAPPASTA